jgi:hypothetical protein
MISKEVTIRLTIEVDEEPRVTAVVPEVTEVEETEAFVAPRSFEECLKQDPFQLPALLHPLGVMTDGSHEEDKQLLMLDAGLTPILTDGDIRRIRYIYQHPEEYGRTEWSYTELVAYFPYTYQKIRNIVLGNNRSKQPLNPTREEVAEAWLITGGVTG